MALRIASIQNQIPFMQRSVEEVADGDVFITLAATLPGWADRFVHWRFDKGRLIPLDVAISTPDGLFHELTIFLQRDALKPAADGLVLPQSTPGIPVFDLSHWPQSAERVDEAGEMSSQFVRTGMLIVVGSLDGTIGRIDAGPLHFLVNETSEVVGFFLPQLDDVSLSLLRHAGVLETAARVDDHIIDTDQPPDVATIKVVTTFEYR